MTVGQERGVVQYWGQPGASVVAFRAPQAATGCGACQRSAPTGGRAYGMPRKIRALADTKPWGGECGGVKGRKSQYTYYCPIVDLPGRIQAPSGRMLPEVAMRTVSWSWWVKASLPPMSNPRCASRRRVQRRGQGLRGSVRGQLLQIGFQQTHPAYLCRERW